MERAQHEGAVAPVAVVTGGGRGIGRAAALALAGAGHRLCVNDTGVDVHGDSPDPAVATEVAAAIRARGGTAMASALDCRTPNTARALVAEVTQWAGEPPSVLVHSAGTLRDAMAHKASDGDWAEVIGSHLGVGIEITRAMAPDMRARGYGRFVYIGGAAGLVGSTGQAAYAVAKAGLFGLTRAMALEMAGRDVSVNYLAPFAFTRMTESIPLVTEQLRRYVQSARLATAGDIAPFVAWLCSPAARGVTGQVFGARGGEISVWSQPRPVAVAQSPAGWKDGAVAGAHRRLEEAFVALESEFDLFGGPPVAVGGRSQP